MSDHILPPIGHNVPPATPLERAAELIETANRWRAERSSISDADMAGRALELTLQLRACSDDLLAEQKRERAPHDTAIAAIKRKFEKPLEMMRLSLDWIETINRAWLQRERDRLTAERAEQARLAREAEEAALRAGDYAARPGASVEAALAAEQAIRYSDEAAAAFAVALSTRAQTRSDLAPKAMSLRTTWRARITDANLARAHYARDAFCLEAFDDAIEKVASHEAKKVKDPNLAPPGIEFYKDEKAV